MNHLKPLRHAAAGTTTSRSVTGRGSEPAMRPEPGATGGGLEPPVRSSHTAHNVIYIFLSGGLSQLDSFDMKPEAPDNIRGEFQPIDTATPGIQICEHLPRLAQRSHLWALCRSLTHRSNEHSAGHHIMLTARSDLPKGFRNDRPQPSDWPSIASIAGTLLPRRNNLPPAAVLPDRLIHATRRVIPGQFAGLMGPQHDPWFIETAPFSSNGSGAFPEYEFNHQDRPIARRRTRFEAPSLSLLEGLSLTRVASRARLLRVLDRQRGDLESCANTEQFDRYRQCAISLLTGRRIRDAIDVYRAPVAEQQRYGQNSFGWSLLMARRLVEAGVSLVQVHLGNDETWDTHGEAFPHLRDKLFPPSDRAVSALLDDLHERGLLESTLIVMAGEFGRTPKISHLPQFYKLPGRDHWGAVQTVFFAGGGVRGGTLVGSSDKIAAFPASDPKTPENLGATIYSALGLPETLAWQDQTGRPHQLYNGPPITELF
jgi:Protein of unknown function (DUF1501)